ncbi:carbohydrate porin [Novosphingobium mathurense]|uniref:Porin n=1 Tax=Novosphingobium mathurense TaxID=428990 RepID=A0A1U6IA92_9SPHN|nr:carbohydrate porin [Novosphingobium mathurense]SLK04936.1 porin [Novosphingobium mathurense]
MLETSFLDRRVCWTGAAAFAALFAVPEKTGAQEIDAGHPVQTTTERRQGEAERMKQTEAPLDIAAAYTADVWHNSGGTGSGWRYLDNLDVTAELDLEAAAGWEGARVFGYVLYNNGRSLSELTGDAQVVSNIETGVRALRLYEAWIEQDIAPGASVKVGLYDLNSEFDALDAGALFIGSAHGIGTDISQSGESGPSIFPLTSLALRLQADLGEGLTVRFAALDGVPGDPDHPKRTAIELGHGDGALLIGEANWSKGPLRILAGAWGYTSDFDRHDGTGSGKSRGAYLRGEMILSENADHKLSAFVRGGVASGAVNPFGTFLSGGVTLDLPGDWQLGAALAHARTSTQYRAANPSTRAETALELTVAKALTPWLSIQPDLQYVIDPGAVPGVDDALAAGLRITLSI